MCRVAPILYALHRAYLAGTCRPVRTYGTAYAGLTVPKWGSGTAAILVTPTRTEPSAERHVPSNSTRGNNTKRGSDRGGGGGVSVCKSR